MARRGLLSLDATLAAAGNQRPGVDPGPAADMVWALVHPGQWRLLVEECGWSQEAFREDRLTLIRAAILA